MAFFHGITVIIFNHGKFSRTQCRIICYPHQFSTWFSNFIVGLLLSTGTNMGLLLQ